MAKKVILLTGYNHVEDGVMTPYAVGDDISHLDASVIKSLSDAGHIKGAEPATESTEPAKDKK